MSNQEKLSKLHPELAAKVSELLALAEKEGFQLQIVQGLRTFAEQDALYAQGRTKPGKRVTNAKGGRSNHNYALAADLAFVVNGQVSWDEKLYPNIGKWANKVGLAWGGNWVKFKDLPHVELKNIPNHSVLLGLYKQGGLPAVWKLFGSSAPVTPTSKPPAFELSRGAKGEPVRRLQEKLFEMGFLKKADIDAAFGKVTEAALQRFQLKSGLVADGICGEKTRIKLFGK